MHEQHRPAKAFADLAHVKSGQQSNICYHFKLRTGDVDKAFAEADRVFEDTFSSPPAQHMPMEPHVTLAYLDEGQRINIWTASQIALLCAYGNRHHLRRSDEPHSRANSLSRRRLRRQALRQIGAAGDGAGLDHQKAGSLRA